MSVPAAGDNSAASASGNDAVADSAEHTMITEFRNGSLDMPNTSEHIEQTLLSEYVSDGINAACGSSCNNSKVVDDSLTMDGPSVEEMCHKKEPSFVTVIEPGHSTEAADELKSSVAQVAPAADPVSGPLQSTAEECRFDVVTFNLPLEVIGACWFMKRDTSTCLQATTSDDGLFCCITAVSCV